MSILQNNNYSDVPTPNNETMEEEEGEGDNIFGSNGQDLGSAIHQEDNEGMDEDNMRASSEALYKELEANYVEYHPSMSVEKVPAFAQSS